jgi:RNA polymerase sigma-70 factor (ECF subfamily)
MTSDEVEKLLGRLGRGETAAAEELYAAYAAYIRTVVRRQLSARLRAQFDSADVVQSVWVQIIRGIASTGWRVESESQLRALLGVVARRRLFTRARVPAATAGTVLTGDELDAFPARGQPRASEVARADELWHRLLALCPPEHRDVLHLRREGVALAEIAEQTGLHEGSVRRILRRLSRELALRTGPPPSESGTAP